MYEVILNFMIRKNRYNAKYNNKISHKISNETAKKTLLILIYFLSEVLDVGCHYLYLMKFHVIIIDSNRVNMFTKFR